MGHRDISSSPTWAVIFDIILRALEASTDDPFMLLSPDGADDPAPEIAYADDLVSLSASLRPSSKGRYSFGLCHSTRP